MAGGTVFWQATGDAYEVDAFTAAGTDPPSNRPQDTDVVSIGSTSGGATTSEKSPAPASGRTIRRRSGCSIGRGPAGVEPADLILDPAYHPVPSPSSTSGPTS